MAWDPARRAAIGGRWAISVPAYVVLVLLFVVPRVLTAGRGGTGGSSRDALVTGALTAFVAAALLVLADRTVFRGRGRQPVPVSWVAMLGAALGAVAGVIGVAAGDAAPVIIPVHMLQGAVIWPFFAFVLATHDAYRRERDALVRAEMQLEAERMRETGAAESLRLLTSAAGWRDVEQSLRDTDALLAAAGGEDGWVQAARALRQAARDVVRPTSHRLRSDVATSARPLRARRILSSALQARPLPIAPVAAVYLFVMWSAIAAGVTLGPGAIVSSSAAVVAMAAIYGVAAWGRGVVPARWWLLVSALAIGAAASVAGLIAIAVTPSAVAGGVLMAGVLVLVTLAVTFAVAAVRSERALIAALRERISAREVELATVRATRRAVNADLADYLHGTVQARLAAAAYAIHEAGTRGDQAALGAAVADARMALDAVLDERGPGSPDTLDHLMACVNAEWAGMLHITWDLPADPIAPGAVDAVDAVIRQALGNAVIHGAATHAAVAVRAGEVVTVSVGDDGLGPRGGPAGMGTRTVDAITGGAWSLQAGGHLGGALLTATIA